MNKPTLDSFVKEAPDSIEDCLVTSYELLCKIGKTRSVVAGRLIVVANRIFKKFNMKTTREIPGFDLTNFIKSGVSILSFADDSSDSNLKIEFK